MGVSLEVEPPDSRLARGVLRRMGGLDPAGRFGGFRLRPEERPVLRGRKSGRRGLGRPGGKALKAVCGPADARHLPLQLSFQAFAQPQPASMGEGLGQLVVHHVHVDRLGGRILDQPGLDDRFLGLGEDLAQQDGLKRAARLGDLLALGELGAGHDLLQREPRGVDRPG